MSRLKPSDAKIIEQTIIQAVEPLTKDETIPAIFASLMGYFEAMNWDLDQCMVHLTETFGYLNKLKISGKLEQEMIRLKRNGIYTH